ncbi:hypothetical protein MJA45_10685 [Paenibacillus aurantius]|uniref:Uncharacterized protein n=1 Tax=Paenibacillus aurantius TaxID=2918900 RepID=A0AA96LJV8_9BACL|nr:hypothetical protein [Paenibacillus aurantius]WJH33029.1 hypothetical protein N6H14_22900 [Paenibacillus sp. CC-CFT747]WNQ13456.1 hypothetical protein MJA45_10685 [Paenibacillus aurantius]
MLETITRFVTEHRADLLILAVLAAALLLARRRRNRSPKGTYHGMPSFGGSPWPWGLGRSKSSAKKPGDQASQELPKTPEQK